MNIVVFSHCIYPKHWQPVILKLNKPSSKFAVNGLKLVSNLKIGKLRLRSTIYVKLVAFNITNVFL